MQAIPTPISSAPATAANPTSGAGPCPRAFALAALALQDILSPSLFRIGSSLLSGSQFIVLLQEGLPLASQSRVTLLSPSHGSLSKMTSVATCLVVSSLSFPQ